MLRLILGFIFVLTLAFAAAWLADQPGEISLRWGGYEITTSVLSGAIFLAILVVAATLLWRSYYWLTGAPGAIGDWFRNRGRRKGFEALSHGLIAAGAGDADAAAREVAVAERHLKGTPLTLLLKAQTAQLKGEVAAVRRAYEAMLDMPETETLGLRGLFLEARRTGDADEAKRLVEQAVAQKPSMGWASQALFELQAAGQDWTGACLTLDLRRRHRHIDKAADARARAVILTAEAQAAEDTNRDNDALEASLAAHRLAPHLVPAAAIAGRILAGRGELGRTIKVVEKAWRLAPHPDLAMIFTHARPGDSTQDRLARARQLATKISGSPEGPIGVARAAIEAREWEVAREAIDEMIEASPTRRVCMLMAEIENGEHGNRGRVREWLARAVSAPRDPAWTADAYVSDRWLPVSPETGAFDVFEWRVPVEGALPDAGQTIENLALGGEQPPVSEALQLGPSALPAESNLLVAETGQPNDTPTADRPESALETDGATTTEISVQTGPRDAKPVDSPVLIAPIPDDPGIEGDDFGDAEPRPKDI